MKLSRDSAQDGSFAEYIETKALPQIAEAKLPRHSLPLLEGALSGRAERRVFSLFSIDLVLD
jgi:hypothetical protein